jgi:hypothetical protein
MLNRWRVVAGLLVVGLGSAAWAGDRAATPPHQLAAAGRVVTDAGRGEVVLHAVVQRPVDKPCIDAYGQRVQAFVGCSRAAGSAASMAGYFVILVDVPTEAVYDAMLELGARPRVAYSMAEGHKRSGLKGSTTAADFLQGDPVTLSVFWRGADGGWVERPYQEFVTERVEVDGKAVEKPWTPSFAFHGSGAIFHSGTGCIACPCDCAGGIIADNRYPLYEPKPTVRFDMSKAPPVGTEVYVCIRPACSARPGEVPKAGAEMLRSAAAPVESAVPGREGK